MESEKKHLPDSGDGIKAIAALVEKAQEIELLSVSTEGLGDGLPENVPVLLDHRPGGLISDLKNVVEAYRNRPERRTGIAKVETLASFCDLVNRHKSRDSALFARALWPVPHLQAVIDYHGIDGTPAHRTHRVKYEFPITPEFKAWIDGNGKPMEQADFAVFLEDHAAELSAPYDQERTDYERLFKEKMATPADLISLSRNLEIHVSSKVKRAERLATGERTVEFVEEHSNGRGEKVEIPGIFMIAVPAFLDGQPARIPARLRYRAAGGMVSWAYQLYRWDFWLREQVKADFERAAKETGLPAFEG